MASSRAIIALLALALGSVGIRFGDELDDLPPCPAKSVKDCKEVKKGQAPGEKCEDHYQEEEGDEESVCKEEGEGCLADTTKKCKQAAPGGEEKKEERKQEGEAEKPPAGGDAAGGAPAGGDAAGGAPPGGDAAGGAPPGGDAAGGAAAGKEHGGAEGGADVKADVEKLKEET